MINIPLYDYECVACGHVTETIAGYDELFISCEKCQNPAKRIISMNRVNTANQDAPWIRTVLEVVDKKGKEPETQEFLRDPTRANYKAWMKARGIRPMEPGEERPRRADTYEETREKRLMYMAEQHRKRNAIEVRG